MKQSCVTTIKGVRCVIIPVDANDIYLTAEEETLKVKGAYLGLNITERRQPSQHGSTHYAKQSFSKTFRENKAPEYEERNKVYLGDFKPNEYQAPQPEIPAGQVDNEDDLPF